MNLKGVFSHNSDDWATPSKLYDAFMKAGYTDPCPLHCTENNLDNMYMFEKLFINPPFSKLNEWIDKAIFWAAHGCEVWLLMPSRTDTKYFNKLTLIGKPFIVENVLNSKQFHEYGLDKIKGIRMFKVGRHTYWTNIPFNTEDIVQIPKVEIRDGKRIYWSSQQLGKRTRQGTDEVHEVIERFLKEVHKYGWLA